MVSFEIRKGYCQIEDSELVIMTDARTTIQNILKYEPIRTIFGLCCIALLIFLFFTSDNSVKGTVLFATVGLLTTFAIFTLLTLIADRLSDDAIPMRDISKVVYHDGSRLSSAELAIHYSKDGKERKRHLAIGFQFGPLVGNPDDIKAAFRNAGITVEDA